MLRSGFSFPVQHLLAWLLLVLGSAAGMAAAPAPIDEAAPWPRVGTTNGNTLTLYTPQVERWTSNWFSARAAVEVKPAGAKEPLLGVIWFEAHGKVDRAKRLVLLEDLEITKARFPEAKDNGSNALSIVREVLPSKARTVSYDYLITTLGFTKAAARQGAHGLKHDAPEIIWMTNRAVLIVIDGEPVLRPVPGGGLQRVVNTPALLVYDGVRFFLAGEGLWFVAGALQGPWALAQTPPAEVAALMTASTPTNTPGRAPPQILVRSHPAELLVTTGLAKPVPGTALQAAVDTDSQLFFLKGQAYLLLSGRWFTAKSLRGPWSHVPPHELPKDFARISPGSPQAVVLASVPDTPQADLALLANSVPTTATVDRRQATIQLSYDGEPKFKPIEGTQMNYAINAQLPVIGLGQNFYALDNGVWFVATNATGPWQVATEVPEEIYTIPPDSPVYYATFARVCGSDGDEVDVSYTPGYQGSYEDEGTVVYGTGYAYDPWCGDYYYGWGWSWGYGWAYVPWYQWWNWRNWWDHPNALRSTVMENVYNRWQGRNGVVPLDRPATGASARAAVAGGSGYPALYGRFQGSSRPEALSPPANTLALNPYSRPKTVARPGETPTGAQLLSAVRQAPGGGRDLYAAADGRVYMRKNDGWYRRESGSAGSKGSGWNLVAPLQGSPQAGRGAEARAAGTAAAGLAQRPGAARDGGQARAEGLRDRLPDSRSEAGMQQRERAEQLAALEREHYARSLAQMRAQNWRGSGRVAGRGGGRRR